MDLDPVTLLERLDLVFAILVFKVDEYRVLPKDRKELFELQ